MFNALPAILHTHPHVRKIPAVGEHEVIILPCRVRVLGRTSVLRPPLLAVIRPICCCGGSCACNNCRNTAVISGRRWVHLQVRVDR